MVGVTMRPQTDLWAIQDELLQIAYKATVHEILVPVELMGALTAGCMMTHYHIATIWVLSHGLLYIAQCALMIFTGILGHEPVLAATIFDHMEVAHHVADAEQGDGITAVHVSPQGHAHEANIINHYMAFFQHMHIGQVSQATAEMIQRPAKIAMIMLMIAHHVDHVWKGLTASLKERHEVLDFVGHTDVAT